VGLHRRDAVRVRRCRGVGYEASAAIAACQKTGLLALSGRPTDTSINQLSRTLTRDSLPRLTYVKAAALRRPHVERVDCDGSTPPLNASLPLNLLPCRPPPAGSFFGRFITALSGTRLSPTATTMTQSQVAVALRGPCRVAGSDQALGLGKNSFLEPRVF
jgi:hypothetical protein